MRISHIAIYVADLEAMKDFYVRYFGAIPNEKYSNDQTGLQTYFLAFNGEVRIEIMSRPDLLERNKYSDRIGFSHLAFRMGSREDVDQQTARLMADGFTVSSRPRVTGDGYYESVVLDPEGNRIEITA